MLPLRIAAVASTALLLPSCAANHPQTPQIAAPARADALMPHPPRGAAASLTLPARLQDGSFATPNRALSDAGTLWHLRAALNVAALQCGDSVAVSAYNRLLASRAKPLAAAHRELAAEYRVVHGATWQPSFDAAMTRLYNYFALPPVRADFCAAALVVLSEAATLPAERLADWAPAALARVEAPFLTFFTTYGSYRLELATWNGRAPQRAAAPRLAYHLAVFQDGDVLTGGGRTRLASR